MIDYYNAYFPVRVNKVWNKIIFTSLNFRIILHITLSTRHKTITYFFLSREKTNIGPNYNWKNPRAGCLTRYGRWISTNKTLSPSIITKNVLSGKSIVMRRLLFWLFMLVDIIRRETMAFAWSLRSVSKFGVLSSFWLDAGITVKVTRQCTNLLKWEKKHLN